MSTYSSSKPRMECLRGTVGHAGLGDAPPPFSSEIEKSVGITRFTACVEFLEAIMWLTSAVPAAAPLPEAPRAAAPEGAAATADPASGVSSVSCHGQQSTL